MIKSLQYTSGNIHGNIAISGSKSESNRLLILQKSFPNLKLENLSDSDDTKHLQEALASQGNIIDIGHAGTAMRFLTAYFSAAPGREITLTGSHRMQNRPIKILVEAMKNLGADIEYLEKEGYPPLRIKGKKLTKNKVRIQGNVSSQYISALLLIAASLENGLEIELLGKVTSVPYIKMTLSLLQSIEIETNWTDNFISIQAKNQTKEKTHTVESDWSSASYFYSLVALSENGKITLSSFKKDSLQGDNSLIETYKHFGVTTEFNKNEIILTKENIVLKPLTMNLVNSPDLAQTIAVTCFGLGIACDLTGLHTLKIKETDRLVALKIELEKLGAHIEITNNSLHLKPSNKINKNITIDTYQDHRMAMAFAPLVLKVPISINEAEVVTKSFTSFWKDFDDIIG
ncbi:MAG: 3-phosphoshikimate 1-carboxyvinyltransferase [Flavobacteriaceae bacterium]|nr:3-phosphoshikimate 1-carboxyvinyltransferase [Flavobacteriaceae bacterium]